MHRFAGHAVGEGDSASVEGDALHAKGVLLVCALAFFAIKRLTQEMQPNGEEVSADLVGVTSEELTFQQAVTVIFRQELETCAGGFAVLLVDAGTVQAVGVEAQGEVHAGLFPSWGACHQAVIVLVDRFCLEFGVIKAVGIRIASQKHDPAGLFIQAVDDPDLAEARLVVGCQVGQAVVVAILDRKQSSRLIDQHYLAIEVDEGVMRVRQFRSSLHERSIHGVIVARDRGEMVLASGFTTKV